jgi:peptidoglycan-associated lipoprotein
MIPAQPTKRRRDPPGFADKTGGDMKLESCTRFAACLAVAALLAGCASQQQQDGSAAAAASAPGAGSATAPSAAPGSPSQQPDGRADRGATPGGSAAAGLNDPKSMLFKRSVFYEYDQHTVRGDYRALVEAHARYLRANPGANVTIEGNCDERGSREYNLALGQRRADSVKSMMMVLGVPERQIETVSFGEEKPKALGTDEQAWSQNRRSDIVYRKVQ